MKFYNINKLLYECHDFFKPVEEIYEKPMRKEAERIKALKNTNTYLRGEIQC